MRSSNDAQLQSEHQDSGQPVSPSPLWFNDFKPRRWLSQPDLQTIVANFAPRRVHLPPADTVPVVVDAATQSRVVCHCNWQPEPVRADRMTVLLVHGLEGSCQSQYMLGNADKSWRAGWNVIRMNMRNCGGTELLAPTLYHSGLSRDVAEVSEYFVAQYGLSQLAWVGYSMGGNLVLKAAGEYGSAAPDWLRAVVGVSPVVDLHPSADALHQGRNRLYEWNFLQNMLRRYRRKAKLFPGRFSLANCKRVRSIRTYDEYIVAPNCGFAGADDYYYRAAAARVLDRIAVPTLILHSLDDPFIRMLPETRATIQQNPSICLIETRHGGHCAFLEQPSAGDAEHEAYDGYWAEKTLHRYIQWQARQSPQPNRPASTVC